MQKLFETSDAVVSYRIEGEGTAVVLLHGFGQDSNVWNEQVNYLKSHCRLIVPDLPGSGKSVFKNNPSALVTSSSKPSTVEYYADCIKALLAHENIIHCIMLGHSLGGYITLSFAERYPQQLAGFGLVHSTAFEDNEEKKLNRQKSIRMIKEYGSYAFIKNTMPPLFGKLFKVAHPEKIKQIAEAGNNFSKHTLQLYYSAMRDRPDRTAVLQNSEVPVLFVIGTEDIAAPQGDVLKQVHLPKIVYIHIFEKIGHMGMLEAPEKMNTALLEFIKGVI